jgi:hypothetical protein
MVGDERIFTCGVAGGKFLLHDPNSKVSCPVEPTTPPTHSKAPTFAPTKTPTLAPTKVPTLAPTKAPTPAPVAPTPAPELFNHAAHNTVSAVASMFFPLAAAFAASF